MSIKRKNDILLNGINSYKYKIKNKNDKTI